MAAFMDDCAITIPTRSACLCSPGDISFTDIWAIAMACLLFSSDAAIWVIATAYLFPFIHGTNFSGGFLTLALRAAIPWRGGAGSSGIGMAGGAWFPRPVVRVHH
jgi:hypothetical protein